MIVSTPVPDRFFVLRNVLKMCGLCLLGALTLLGASASFAEMVILSDGDFIKVDGFKVEGEKVHLDLPSGGRLVLSIRRVSRIVDDEVATVRDDEVIDSPGPLIFQLRFDPEHGVPDGPYGELIHQTAERHGLNPALVAAVIRAESAFQKDAVSIKGARGLMQLMPATAERFGLDPDRSFEPALNLDAGCRYLRWLADRFEDDLARVLAAYNSGEGTVARYGGVPPYRETRGYLRRIYDRLGLELVLEPLS